MIRQLILGILVLLALYGVIEAWPLMRGPTLAIDSPADNTTVLGGIVALSGRVARASTLTVNGVPLLQDQQGAFSSILTFPRGGSILTLVVTDRFGRHTRATRTIFVP